jgi:hypothetical protein
MPTQLSKYNALALATVLSALMWATRGHHAASLAHLPDASWAVFFMLGFYFRSRMLLPLFLAQAALVDYLSITQFGTDNYCVTSAYAFLLPAYSALWMAGHWFASHFRRNAHTLPLFAISVTVGAFVCELISSGSFYFLGERTANTSMQEFGSLLVQYFPGDLGWMASYLGFAVLAHILITGARRNVALTH